jgi:hypothetical protein
VGLFDMTVRKGRRFGEGTRTKHGRVNHKSIVDASARRKVRATLGLCVPVIKICRAACGGECGDGTGKHCSRLDVAHLS